MRMSWWSYLAMLLVYLLYLFIGALVFSHLESDAEKKRCDIAKENVRNEKGEFASSYFYTFSLNKKFCEGKFGFTLSPSIEFTMLISMII